MDRNQKIDIEGIALLSSGVISAVIGAFTLLFFTSDAFYNFNCWFFGLSLCGQLICIFIDYKNDKRQTAPRSIQVNPHVHNALMFLVFMLTSSTSIIYIVDTIFLQLQLIATFAPVKDVKKILSGLTESKSIKVISNWAQILVIPELLLWLIVNHTLGVLFSFIVYIVNIAMFGYAISGEIRDIYVPIYSAIRKQYRNNTGALKSILEVILSFADFLSNFANQFYKVPPLRTTF